jgi:hypothetical protein
MLQDNLFGSRYETGTFRMQRNANDFTVKVIFISDSSFAFNFSLVFAFNKLIFDLTIVFHVMTTALFKLN